MPFFSLPTGGSPVLAGVTAPTGGVGNVGDLFIDQVGKLLYGPKEAGGWPSGPIDLSNGPVGATGATGANAPPTTLSIGTVATGATAQVTITGAAPSQTLSFVIPFLVGPTGPSGGPTGSTGPQGQSITGPTAPASTLSVGSVNTGAAPSVTITGVAPTQTVDFVFPVFVGPTGPSGGPTGERGERGDTGPSGGPTGDRGPTGDAGGYDVAQLINARTADYTLVLSDAGKLVTMSSATGTLFLTLPPASSVAFATGTHVDVARIATGAVTITGATGVTVHATPGQRLRARYSAASCVLYQGDTWLVVGDTTS